MYLLAEAFYRRVETDPILRPLYPRTLGCPTRILGAFLANLSTGDAQYPAHFRKPRLRALHARFGIDTAMRDAWLRNMAHSLEEIGLEEPHRSELFAALTGAASFLAAPPDNSPLPAPPTNAISSRFRDMIAADEILNAVESGDADYIRGCASHDVLALVESGTGGPAMYAMAAFGTSGVDDLFELAESRIRKDPTIVHTRFGGDQTLLHRAAAAWNVSFARVLFEHQADPNVVDAVGHPPLYYAGNRLESDAIDAKVAGRLVSMFAERGANLDLAHGVKRCAPLHMAARRGHADFAAALVRHGANIEARDSNGETPLRRAVNCNKVEVVRVLIEMGADPNARCNRGVTPLESARKPIIRELL